MNDNINPDHYKSRSIECIEFTSKLNFVLGNAFKYTWRLGMKDSNDREILKIKWYLTYYYVNKTTKFIDNDVREKLQLELESMKNEFSKETFEMLSFIILASYGIFSDNYTKYIS